MNQKIIWFFFGIHAFIFCSNKNFKIKVKINVLILSAKPDGVPFCTRKQSEKFTLATKFFCFTKFLLQQKNWFNSLRKNRNFFYYKINVNLERSFFFPIFFCVFKLLLLVNFKQQFIFDWTISKWINLVFWIFKTDLRINFLFLKENFF